MNCYFHEDRIAVGTCQGCGKALCKECANKYAHCLCNECAHIQQANFEAVKKQQKKDAFIDTHMEFGGAILKGLACAILFTLLFGLTTDRPAYQEIIFGILFFFVPFGWAVLTYIEQWLPTFLMDGIIWAFYMIIKLCLSIVLGIPCFIFQTVKYVYRLIKHTRG